MVFPPEPLDTTSGIVIPVEGDAETGHRGEGNPTYLVITSLRPSLVVDRFGKPSDLGPEDRELGCRERLNL